MESLGTSSTRGVNWKQMCVAAQDLCSKQDEVGDGGRNTVREEDERDAKGTPAWGNKYSCVDIFESDSYVAKSDEVRRTWMGRLKIVKLLYK